EAELVAAIEYHNRRYWEIGEPEISDEDYDALLRKLESLNPDHPLLQKVLAPAVASTGKVKLDKPMLSLDKVYYFKEEDIPPEEKKKNKKSLMKWLSEIKRSDDEVFLIQPKLDGISANFANNVLSTRGDGIIGENITDKLPLIELETKGHKGKLDRPARGEIVIRDDDFKTLYSHIKRKDGKTYKNSRNAVAGIMGLKEIGDILAQGAKLTFVDYNLVSYSVTFAEFAEKWPEILKEVEELPYPMDGLVIKLADEAYGESLGNTAHHPRGQIAFKFSGVRRKTRLLDVMWSFGKNCLTPVAQLEPVEIGGITIKQATLHNVKNLIDKDIQIGDMVIVERAGDVIPYIVSREEGGKRRSPIIAECPCCKSKLITDGPELRCTNPECTETKVQRILAAVRNIGIERLGEPNIRKMMNTLGVKTLKDIFELEIEDILKLEGFKEKSAGNLIREIQTARRVEDFSLLAALNIPGIGKNTAKKILENYTLAELRTLKVEQLSAIDGIGPERSDAISRELRSQSAFLDELLGSVELITTKGGVKISAPTICFTGKMPEQRSYYENLARESGYEPVDAVTKELSLLVAADLSSASSKLDKARSHGVKIQSLEDWIKTQTPHSPTVKTAPRKTHDTPDLFDLKI
ncbi:MAG: helix-hairpin-helix domain-containing protein, partial [Victivallales bacterium]